MALIGPAIMGLGCRGPKHPPLPPVLITEEVDIAGSGDDDSFVDELLNFDNDNTEEEEEEEDGHFFSPQLTHKNQKVVETTIASPPTQNKGSLKEEDFGSVLTLQEEEDDDGPDLEWLSQFMEDSFSQFPTPYPVQPCPGPETTRFPALSMSKSKRRIRGRTNSDSPRRCSLSSDSTTTTTTISSSSSSHHSPAKKQRTELDEESRGWRAGGRRCSHCGVSKTPQWRTGPKGAKTLCNACGVRYKSGRLLPEYRPASSPNFSAQVHSNSHRKVMEMRRQNEQMTMMRKMMMAGWTGEIATGFSGPVRGFVSYGN